MYPVDCLIAHFASYLDLGVSRPDQLDTKDKQYLTTIKLRGKFPTVRDALANDDFLQNVHSTLLGYFGLARSTKILPLELFRRELRRHEQSIASFDGKNLAAGLSATCVEELWKLIQQLTTVECKRRLVSGTKTLHLLLPDLVVPVDGKYTGAFLFRYGTDFDAGDPEQQTFRIAFAAFQTIAKAVDPKNYVGKHPMHTTPTKVIDNGVMGFVERVRMHLVKH
jgi:hypothetical protein